MFSTIINWLAEKTNREEFYDAYFAITELTQPPQPSQPQPAEFGYYQYDALARQLAEPAQQERHTPIGKLVL